jgi:hypothetical protein
VDGSQQGDLSGVDNGGQTIETVWFGLAGGVPACPAPVSCILENLCYDIGMSMCSVSLPPRLVMRLTIVHTAFPLITPPIRFVRSSSFFFENQCFVPLAKKAVGLRVPSWPRPQQKRSRFTAAPLMVVHTFP